MNFQFSQSVGPFTLHYSNQERAQKLEKELESIQAKLNPYLADQKEENHIYIIPEFLDEKCWDESWDLFFWLKRGILLSKGENLENQESKNALFQACLYKEKEDLLETLGLFFTRTPKAYESMEEPTLLPLSYKGNKSAFFLDRDGIINVDKAYVFKKEDVEFMPGITSFIQFLQTKYDYVVVLTNQSGVGRGYYKEEDVQELHKWMDVELQKSEALIDRWYYCPFHPKGESEEYCRDSYLRKPGSGMGLVASQELSLDLDRCAMVGDKDSDFLVDLCLPTYLIQGNYELKSNLPQFKNLKELQNFLATL